MTASSPKNLVMSSITSDYTVPDIHQGDLGCSSKTGESRTK